MSIEAELTALLAHPEQVRAALAGRAVGEASVYADAYYDRPDLSMVARGYELRLRTITTSSGDRVVLTYKEPAVDEFGSKPEHETEVAERAVPHTMFLGLGLVEHISYRKHCDNFRFTAHGHDLLASVVRIPELAGRTFLELETITEPDDLSDALTALRAVLGELGVTDQELITDSYTDLVAASRAEPDRR
ncbi:adenylyl cyclase [Actinophytocola xinjiangensis]|uniref:Adenylyl cyclase n=1 Tax=Actinophytocola xinjiangensis TaxID=485602 RepID=A0A7Z0WH80_9PSEU|nr:CYTH domain-containing protein [Actinophytocola xinjiangensis]OLF07116.1 adenylyl cyclase [Actinophytocola xinjiangensis]